MRFCFFFNDTATTEIYTLSLHDALPISMGAPRIATWPSPPIKSAMDFQLMALLLGGRRLRSDPCGTDRKSTRLNSSHANISYAVFCLKKKKNTFRTTKKSCHRSTDM